MDALGASQKYIGYLYGLWGDVVVYLPVSTSTMSMALLRTNEPDDLWFIAKSSVLRIFANL